VIILKSNKLLIAIYIYLNISDYVQTFTRKTYSRFLSKDWNTCQVTYHWGTKDVDIIAFV